MNDRKKEDATQQLERNIQGLSTVVKALIYDSELREQFLEDAPQTLRELGVEASKPEVLDSISARLKEFIEKDMARIVEKQTPTNIGTAFRPRPTSGIQPMARPPEPGIRPIVVSFRPYAIEPKPDPSGTAPVAAAATAVATGAATAVATGVVTWTSAEKGMPDTAGLKLDFSKIRMMDRIINNDLRMNTIEEQEQNILDFLRNR